jgi:hypothetical protein
MPRLWHLIWPLRRQRVGPRRIGSQVDGQEANFLAVRSPESWFMMCGNHGNLKKISDIMSNYWGAYIYILYIYICSSSFCISNPIFSRSPTHTWQCHTYG